MVKEVAALIFKMLSISYGWFEVDFNRQFILTNSHYLSCDAPALLLESLCNLMENITTEEWLCWQDEPGAKILKLEREDEQLVVEIYNTDKASFDLAYSGTNLGEYITECLYKTKDSLTKIVESIYMEFELYEYGIGRKRYDKNWGEFPRQYYRLRKILRGK
ncbi:MAG: hypothetical protein FWG48_00585 [Oscillospiraceae bacterium]|nr:hypothetical protein [Oscillospiraceae bacterium]